MPTRNSIRIRYWREGILVLAALALLGGTMAVGPIPQDPGYHRFADSRAIFGVPNFLNVASNILFLAFGIVGVAFCRGPRKPRAHASWSALFFGGMLISLGSGYYHWAPDNATLVWDRLPMTLAFMGLFAALVSEHLDERLERIVLIPAVVIGAASVAWWHYTNDLGLYVWVQAVPFVAIPLMIAMFPGRYTHRSYLLYGLGFYVLAKIAEVADRELLLLTSNVLSGHSLKHLLAAFSFLVVYLMLRRREPVAGRKDPQ
ncbi:MAG: ceramidase domain-containing protein [Betaproteobacteria bacterium]|nr:ceramidase domain-containing protein [Betaproteobacteria bacterium]